MTQVRRRINFCDARAGDLHVLDVGDECREIVFILYTAPEHLVYQPSNSVVWYWTCKDARVWSYGPAVLENSLALDKIFFNVIETLD